MILKPSEIPESTGNIGYRAHHFEPVWGEREENCIKFDEVRTDDLPFEKNYYFAPEKGAEGEDLICWFVQGEEQRTIEERGLPDYLKIDEKKVLLME